MTDQTGSAPTIEYRIDAQDRILYVGPDWDSTAQRAGTPVLVAANVLHQPLWRFISDRTTRFIYRLLVERVRQRRLPIQLTARCDTPEERRIITIQMRPQVANQVHFISTVTETEARPRVLLLDGSVLRSEQVVVMCSWCKRIELPNGRWVEIEEALATLDLLNQDKMPQISHGMCVECLVAMKQEIAAQA